jgi:hypothetical protein
MPSRHLTTHPRPHYQHLLWLHLTHTAEYHRQQHNHHRQQQ